MTKTIGRSEIVSFPEMGIDQLVAKIDTGADGSSLWATQISVKNNVLSFHFFGPSSPVYRPEPVSTKLFKLVHVKNSFGHKELRYKVKLRIKIGRKVIAAWFSLSNRSNNAFPVLIGKNLLRGHFTVDVSQQFMLGGSPAKNQILILSSNSRDVGAFFESVKSLQKQPVDYDSQSYDSLLFSMAPQKCRVINQTSNKDIAEYRLVYFKNHYSNIEEASAAAEYLAYKSRPFIDRETSIYTSRSKLTEYMKLAVNNLPIPLTIAVNQTRLTGSYRQFKDQLGLPFVVKRASAKRGRDNYLISSRADYDQVVSTSLLGQTYLIQKYVPNGGFLRVYVMGGAVRLVVKRTTSTHHNRLKSHLNKPAGSRNASLLILSELSPEVLNLCVRSAKCLNRQVVGVDIVQDKLTNKWYILEVNYDPQIRSGSFVNEKAAAVARFIDKTLSK